MFGYITLDPFSFKNISIYLNGLFCGKHVVDQILVYPFKKESLLAACNQKLEFKPPAKIRCMDTY